MNSFQLSSLPQNPFTRPAFRGRRNELQTIYKRLLSEPPQCCAIIGETSFGKTTLMRHFIEPQSASVIDAMGAEHVFTFVYLDCARYIELAQREAYASVQFWWEMYSTFRAKLQADKESLLPEPPVSVDHISINTAFEIKSELEGLIRTHQRPVIFVLDNFEGIARLPLRDSEWLRSMAQHNCTYIVSSRHLLYLLYQYSRESWASPSPLWNLFSDPIYLGLMREEEAMDFVSQAGKLENFWKQEDIKFIRRIAGRHPEIMRIACSHLFERRLIERINGEWRVFAEAMRQFALEQEQAHKQSELYISNLPVTSGDTRIPAFAYLEGRVYEYLKSHVGEVCDKEEIKRAVWGNNPPTNSALQKIIERIREKIEPEPENPRYLIAVRGQGFMLREDPLGS